ncbi:MAG: arsenic efflux protein [Eubacteriales bacterium]|nr:arsenic efflux protein [Eubacteriales bacterium]
MIDALLDAGIDGIRLIPFLFLTYLAMGVLEKAAGSKAQEAIRDAGKVGPLWGGILGAFPQCGFSAAASNFYVGRMITLGTLISIYLSTSDEMLPIFISEHVAISTIVKILGAKVLIGMVTGFAVELFFGWLSRKNKKPVDFNLEAHFCGCSCGSGVFVSAVIHTLKVFVFIFIVSFAINYIIGIIGEEALYLLFSDVPVLGELIASLVGLIPNCAASVVVTQLYLDGIIGSGPMMSGLLASAGIGLLVLFKENHNFKENISIVAILYTVSVIWGVIIEALGISF